MADYFLSELKLNDQEGALFMRGMHLDQIVYARFTTEEQKLYASGYYSVSEIWHARQSQSLSAEKTMGGGKYIDARDEFTTEHPHCPHQYTSNGVTIKTPLNVFQGGVILDEDGNDVAETSGVLYKKPTALEM